MTFWTLAIAISIIIGVIAFFPLLKTRNTLDHTSRNRLNKAFYFDRLNEVEQEAAKGVIDDPEQTKLELQQSLLDDIPSQAEAEQSAKPLAKMWFVVLLALVVGGSALVYHNVGTPFMDRMMALTHQKLDYFYERVAEEETNPLSEQELNQFSMALRVELQKNPQDHKSWFMLGQVGSALDNGQLAFDSFSKAAALEPDNLNYKLKVAQLLMFSADPQDKTRGEQILKEVIRLDHTNLDALSLLAFNAFEKEDYQMAAMTWGMMLKLMAADDPRRETIERSVQMALSMMKPSEKAVQKDEK